RHIARPVLRFPGKALAHRVELADIGEMLLDQVALARPHRALDELHDGRWLAVGDVAEDHAEGARRLALALAGVNDDEPLLVRLGRHVLVTRGLLLRHLLVVTGVVLFGGVYWLFAHGWLPALFLVSLRSVRSNCAELLRGVHSPRSIASSSRSFIS